MKHCKAVNMKPFSYNQNKAEKLGLGAAMGAWSHKQSMDCEITNKIVIVFILLVAAVKIQHCCDFTTATSSKIITLHQCFTFLYI